MTHTYSLNFEKSIISASCVHGSRKRCKKAAHKCYEFFTKDLENRTGENVPIVPAKRRYLPWLFGPATSLITRSIIYPCTKYRCSLPCMCFICHKNPPTCSVPINEACHCQDCQRHFDDHRLYHAVYHQACKSCAQIVQAMPQLNFYFLFNSSEQFRNRDRKYHGYFNGDELDFERPGVILHPGQKMKWDEWRKRYDNWLAGITGEDDIWCPGCPKLFFSYDLLREHMTTTHTISKSFRHYYEDVITAVPTVKTCDQCGTGRQFSRSCDLQRHVDSVHIKEYIRCEFCAMKFSRWDSYKRHKLRKHDSSDKNVCWTCGMKYDNAGALMKHIGDGPECNSSLKCEKCATTFSRMSDLKRHKKSTIKVTCDICGKEACNGKVLKDHIKSEHEDPVNKLKCHLLLKEDCDGLQDMEDSKFYKCEQCSKEFINHKRLKLHEVIHRTEKNFKCDICNTIFRWKSSLIKHKKTMMKTDGAPNLSCTICDIQFCTGKDVKSHNIFVHRKQFSCKICGQSFTLKKSLELHVKNRVSISCRDCGNIFCNKRAHTRHSYDIHGKHL